jgi:hypothetical protein
VSGYRWHERLFVAGYTGSGKSEILNLYFSQLRCQRLLVDTKPEFEIPGVQPTRSLDELDWRAPIIHYQDASGDLDEYDRLFYAAHHRRNLVVCVHELADLCEDQPNKTPKWVRAYIRKGNIRGNGLLAASQRPVGMPRIARTEAQHVIATNPPVDEEDRKIVAKMTQRSLQDFDEALGHARGLGDQYSWACFSRGDNQLRISGPLPEHVRGGIIVRRAINLS